MYLADGLTLRISAPWISACSHTPAELGMTKTRKVKADVTKKWDIMSAVCEGRCNASWEEAGCASFGALKVQVGELNKLLREIFGLSGQPLSCSKGRDVVAAFNALPEAPDNGPYINTKPWSVSS